LSNSNRASPLFDFDARLAIAHGELRAGDVQTLQINVGKLCNQACKHCHVDASPARTEIMTQETAEAIIKVVRSFRLPVLDITGGAPELCPSFRYLVREARAVGTHVIVRHNLTVMFEAGQEDLPEFFHENESRGRLFASLLSRRPHGRATRARRLQPFNRSDTPPKRGRLRRRDEQPHA
jgi:radical SAM/Cys-rich protein